MEMVKKILPKQLVTKGILIFAIVVNVYASIGNYIAPYVYKTLSFEWLYIILMFIQILGVVVYCFAFTKIKKCKTSRLKE